MSNLPNPFVPVRNIKNYANRIAKFAPMVVKNYGQGLAIFGGVGGFALLWMVEPDFVFKYLPYYSKFHKEE